MMFPSARSHGVQSATTPLLLLNPFVHQSSLSPPPHDPWISLASHNLRTAFGETVQRVADTLESRGTLSLAQLKTWLQEKSFRQSQPVPITLPALRASLLVLLQHNLVTVQYHQTGGHQKPPLSGYTSTRSSRGDGSPQLLLLLVARYTYHPDRAVFLLRYARYVEWMIKAVDGTAAALLQQLLLAGRAATDTLVMRTAAQASNTIPEEEKEASYPQQILDALYKLVASGFIEPVPKLVLPHHHPREEEEEGETTMDSNHERERPDDDRHHHSSPKEFDSNRQKRPHSTPPGEDPSGSPRFKKVKFEEEDESTRQNPVNTTEPAWHTTTTTPLVLLLLQPPYQNAEAWYQLWQQQPAPFRDTVPWNRVVWRVQISLFHDHLRAYHLGRLVSDRYGHRVPAAGSLVTAALKFRSAQQQQPTASSEVMASDSTFTPMDTVKYLPVPVRQNLEKKMGGLAANLTEAFRALSPFHAPTVLERTMDDRYQIKATHLTSYLQERVIHQTIYDRHGEVAARVISILRQHGCLESDLVAHRAMVPAKDTREVLHRLYRSRYVEMVLVSTSSRQHHPSGTIYLWRLRPRALLRQITDDVTTALWHLRLRRQRQVEVGKEWIERAQQAEDMDENDHELDRLNYQRFCLGLERLDVAALQLEETLMVLHDF